MTELDEALVRAIFQQDLHGVESALEQGANPHRELQVDVAGHWTPLFFAASTNQARVVELLLARGADPNARDGIGRTPLHYASIHRDGGRTVCALLDAGARGNVFDRDGFSPLDGAAGAGSDEVGKLLIAAGVKCQPINRVWVSELSRSGGQSTDRPRG